MKKIVTIIIGIILVIAVIVLGVKLIKSADMKVDEKKDDELESYNNIEKNEIEENIGQETVKPTQTLEEYIELIYPVRDGDTFPVFESIEEVDDYWLWSTAISTIGTENMGTISATKDRVIESAKKLYGNNIPQFPENSEELLQKLDIIYDQNNNIYSWIGNSRSIPETGHYVITAKNQKEENLFEIEIAEYIVYEWSEPYVLIKDINGNMIQKFDFNVDYSNSDEMEQTIKNYMDKYINNFDKKLLTIKYDVYTGCYNIISSKSL